MSDKIIIGWQEWCGLPSLKIPAIKAKVDTGAQTSALHAYQIETYRRKQVKYVKFYACPLQRNTDVQIPCHTKVIDEREVTSSNGQKEKRFVIESNCQLGELRFPIQITLTNRDIMAFRMLLGRHALKGRVMIDPAKKCCLGNMTTEQVIACY